jgi:hypothetical protein
MTARRLCHGSVGHVPMTLGTWPLSDKCSGRPVQASARYAGQAGSRRCWWTSPSWRRSPKANASSDRCSMAVRRCRPSDADHGHLVPASGETLDIRRDGALQAAVFGPVCRWPLAAPAGSFRYRTGRLFGRSGHMSLTQKLAERRRHSAGGRAASRPGGAEPQATGPHGATALCVVGPTRDGRFGRSAHRT